MRRWRTLVFPVVGVLCVLQVAAEGGAGAAAGSRAATTRLTIQTWPRGVFGYLSSPNAARCASGRRIEVFASGGGMGSRARRIATVTARRNQLGYQWLLGSPRRGVLYAVAPATAGCAAARSSSVRSGLTDLPACGKDRHPECVLVVEFKGLRVGHSCPTFTESSDSCRGWTTRANPAWDADPDKGASFAWDPGFPRPVKFEAGIFGTRTGFLAGTTSCDHCSDLKVSDACNHVAPNDALHYVTANNPGVKPGAPGGPLYLNFDAGTPVTRTVVIIWGVLRSTFTARSCNA